MRTRAGHFIRVETLLGLTQTVVAISTQAQEILNNAAVTGNKGTSYDPLLFDRC
jgi:hypothetical protein